MKALFVAHSTSLSGANKSFISVIENLRTRVEITVLINSTEGDLLTKLNSMGIEHIYCKYSWMMAQHRKNAIKAAYRYLIDTRNYWSRQITPQFIDELSKRKFDFVYTNTSVIDVGAIISEKLKIPNYWHIREFGKEDFDFHSIRSKKYRNNLYNNAEKLIVISKALKDKYSEIVPKENISVVYNGFEVEKLKRLSSIHSFGDTINIIVTGQVCEAKGQEQAIEAVNILVNKGYPIKLFIAGTVDVTYMNPILKRHPGYDKWLNLLGQVSDIYSLRNSMDIELVCSRSEAFGRVTIEAMLHCLPVIGSKAGGTPELIENNKTGMLYEYNDIEGLVECIQRLIEDQKLYASIVENAFGFASEFTIEQTAEQIWKIFAEE